MKLLSAKAKIISVFSLFLALANNLHGQEYIQPEKKSNIGIKVATLAVLDISALVVLSEAWYKDQPRTSFHFFNDWPEWKQADKAGHLFNSYQLAKGAAEALKSWNVRDNKSYLWGSISGFLLMSQVELLDGFSSEYGASWSDLLANAVGSMAAFSQYALWDEQRFHLKYSFHRSGYAAQRPEVLGSNVLEEMLKDYNGQSFWLSIDMDKIMPQSNFPKWLNLALGYSVENIIYARDQMNPFRQYFLSLDLDLSVVRTRRKAIKYLLYGINMIHLPAPALEFNKNRTKFHWFYF